MPSTRNLGTGSTGVPKPAGFVASTHKLASGSTGVPKPVGSTSVPKLVVLRNTNNMKRNNSKCNNKNYYKTIGRRHLAPPLCTVCRRRQYAVACLGKTCTATRWQEWCVPLLARDSMVGNAASTLKLIEMELHRFLGNEVRHINALSRRGAGLEISAVNCECWKAGRIMYEQSNLLPSQLDTSSGISGSTPCAVRSLCTKLTQIGQCKKLTRVCKHASKIATVAVRCRWIS